MHTKTRLTLLLSTSQTAHAAKEYGNVVVVKVGTVIDGNSFKVDINEWPPIVGKGITVRIADIDAPELRGKCDREKQLARQAKQHLVPPLRGASKVELKNLQRGKYFRIVTDVYIDGALFTINSSNRLFFKKYENRGMILKHTSSKETLVQQKCFSKKIIQKKAPIWSLEVQTTYYCSP